LVYYCGQAIPSAICSKSLDGGRSFVSTGAAPFAEISDVLDCGRLTGHGTVGPEGNVYLPTACDKPYLGVSTDEGATWSVVTVSEGGTNGDHEAAVGTDADGTVYYAWIGDDRLPYVSVSEDGGTSWSKPLAVAPRGVRETNIPALDVAPDGTVAVAYMGSTDAPPDRKDYERATWSAYVTVTDDLLRRRPVFHTAVYGNRADPLVMGECGPGRCLAVYDFIDVQFDSRGTVWAALVDGCRGHACTEIGEGVVGSLRF
nr:glycoside hydrolase [Actinomycetota bacterium]